MDHHTLIARLQGEFQDKLTQLGTLMVRESEFSKAANKIKVAIGMRRAGKTYFMYQKVLALLQSGVPITRILYINFEDDRLLPLNQKKCAQLIETFYALYPENHEQKCYLFLDEIQNVEGWSAVIRRFHDSKNVELFLSGSSSKLLSKEIATSLRGRSLATEIWPYSFHEYLSAKKLTFDTTMFDQKTQDKLTQLFNTYLSTGGFPEVIEYTAGERQQTLQEYLDVVIYRDIIERHEIKNVALIKHMILSMLHNISGSFTVNKLYNDLKSQGYKTGKDVLYDYANYIEDTFLIFSVSLMDQSIRKVQANPKKLYAIDPGLVRATTLDYEDDLGKLFENIIYLDLRRQGCSVKYYLTHERYEVDFVATNPQHEKKLFQVAWHTNDKATLAREQRALEAAQRELTLDGEIITLASYLQKGVNF